MISGLIYVPRPDDPQSVDRLADTLSALVEGVAAGLIGDAVIVADAADDTLRTIAEGSGATLATTSGALTPWHAGAKVARRGWVLCLEAGDLPREGWIRNLDRFIGTARGDTALGRLRRRTAWPVRLAQRAERVFGVRLPRAGDLLLRERLLDGMPFRPRLQPRSIHASLDRD